VSYGEVLGDKRTKKIRVTVLSHFLNILLNVLAAAIGLPLYLVQKFFAKVVE
jgi:hypothetical protein